MQTPLAKPTSQPRAPIEPHNHPFPFLLYLEWGLLAIAILIEFLPTPLLRGQRFHVVSLISMVGFGLMGLRLPTGSITQKVGFTILETLLIGLAILPGIRTLRLSPLLHLILVSRSCLMFKLPGRLVVAVIAFGLFLMTLLYRVQLVGLRLSPVLQERIRPLAAGFALISIFLFGLALAFVLLLVDALLSERQSREQLAIANEQLRQYALRIENLAMAQERNRIARDIHDSLGHSLTALNLQLEGALKLWQANPERAKQLLQEAKRLGSTALTDVRQSVGSLRSDPLQGQSLAEAIARLTEDFRRSTGIQPRCQFQISPSLPLELRTALYRIVQEALTNTCKYAAATQVAIQIETTPTSVRLTYRDNGKGFDAQQNRTGFGLQGMQERTLALGGHYKLVTSPGQGCLIQAVFPLSHIG